MQFSIRTLILATAAVAFCLMLAGRDTRKGSVIVSQQYEQFVYSLLARQGINNYESYSSSGITRFHFLDANERSSIEEAIERDALEKGYSFKIKHRTIFPPFNLVKIVNAEGHLSDNH